MVFKLGELLGTIVFFNHLRTVFVDMLLRDTTAHDRPWRRAPCISLNLPLRLASVGFSLQ